jgi:hypothetical protein
MTVVGVTASRHDLPPVQLETCAAIMYGLGTTELHEGECVGGDSQLAGRAVWLGIRIVAHPPEDDRLRAIGSRFDDLTAEDGSPAQVTWLEPRPYRDRNLDIVEASQAVIVAPGQDREVVRSGTWQTKRMAVARQRPLVIVWPDGSTSWQLPDDQLITMVEWQRAKADFERDWDGVTGISWRSYGHKTAWALRVLFGGES